MTSNPPLTDQQQKELILQVLNPSDDPVQTAPDQLEQALWTLIHNEEQHPELPSFFKNKRTDRLLPFTTDPVLQAILIEKGKPCIEKSTSKFNLLVYLIEHDMYQVFDELLKRNYIKQPSLRDKLIEYSRTSNNSSLTSFLMQYTFLHFDMEKEEKNRKQTMHRKEREAELLKDPTSAVYLKSIWKIKTNPSTLQTTLTAFKSKKTCTVIEIPKQIGQKTIHHLHPDLLQTASNPESIQSLILPELPQIHLDLTNLSHLSYIYIPETVQSLELDLYQSASNLHPLQSLILSNPDADLHLTLTTTFAIDPISHPPIRLFLPKNRSHSRQFTIDPGFQPIFLSEQQMKDLQQWDQRYKNRLIQHTEHS